MDAIRGSVNERSTGSEAIKIEPWCCNTPLPGREMSNFNYAASSDASLRKGNEARIDFVWIKTQRNIMGKKFSERSPGYVTGVHASDSMPAGILRFPGASGSLHPGLTARVYSSRFRIPPVYGSFEYWITASWNLRAKPSPLALDDSDFQSNREFVRYTLKLTLIFRASRTNIHVTEYYFPIKKKIKHTKVINVYNHPDLSVIIIASRND